MNVTIKDVLPIINTNDIRLLDLTKMNRTDLSGIQCWAAF